MVRVQAVPVSLSSVARENDAAETLPVEWCIRDGAEAQADEQEQASEHTSVVWCEGPLGWAWHRGSVSSLSYSPSIWGLKIRKTVHIWCYPAQVFTGVPDIGRYLVWAFTGMPFRVGYVYRSSWCESRQAWPKQSPYRDLTWAAPWRMLTSGFN